MLHNMEKLKGFRIQAFDGEIGSVRDVFFDDHSWQVRYLVVRAGNWLSGREVLISPEALGKPQWEDAVLPVKLTLQQVKDSPGVDTVLPVSRQRELQLVQYFGWPMYWEAAYTGQFATGNLFPPSSTAVPLDVAGAAKNDESAQSIGRSDPNLRSMEEVRNYSIRALDGNIGHLDDYLMDDATWTIRYLVVNTHDWIGRRWTLASPEWVLAVDWDHRSLDLGLRRQAVETAPEFHSLEDLTREYEEELCSHYRRPTHWSRQETTVP